MTDSGQCELQARERAEHAALEYASGRLDSAVELVREAVVLYAAADSAAFEENAKRTLARADVCRICGAYLAEQEQYAEAANIYQQAVDQYSRLNSEEAEESARRCAGKLLECIELLKARPYDRLNLLIAQYEQRQRVFAAQPGHVVQEAECAAHIARILQRRERYEQSLLRYREALELYKKTSQEPEVQLAIAECHHRMGGLLAYRLSDRMQARRHFAEAVRIYAQHEPFVYGVQESRALCERALAELEAEE